MNMIRLWWICALALLACVTMGTFAETGAATVESGWNGTWQSQQSSMVLEQDGNVVQGTYVPLDPETSDPGVISGTVSEDGKILTGTWDESGSVTFTLSDDGKSLNGTYGYTDTPDTDEWNATLIEPEGSTPESGWNGTWQSNYYLMDFTRDGDSVMATYEPVDRDRYDPGVIKGTLSDDGKTLNGTWNESGKFEYTLSDDGSVFNGTFGYRDSTDFNPDYTWNATRVG